MYIWIKVHMAGPAHWTLDATPLIRDREYCAEVGFTDGRIECAVRPEGNPERVPCEEYVLGHALDTGRIGPTWTRNGELCDGTYCENQPDNQFLLWTMSSGFYKACSTDGEVCGDLSVVM